jgi:hypothetical protein
MTFAKGNYYIVCDGKKYVFDFVKFEEMFVSLNTQDNREKEITESYTLNESNQMELSGRISRETKAYGIPQNKILSYDIIKMFLERIINDDTTEQDFLTSGLCFAINSLISVGIIVEVE